MWEAYLIIYIPLALSTAFVIWRLYVQYTEEKLEDVKSEEDRKPVPWWKGLIYVILLLITILAFSLFLAIKDELQLPNIVEWLTWLAALSVFLWFFGENKNSKIGNGNSN